MDSLDGKLIAALRRNGRAAISDLAAEVKASRATVRARLGKLEASGEIVGYSVVTRSDALAMPVRGVMMIEIEGKGADRIVGQLAGIAEVEAIHTTNGRWDLILELGTDTLEQLDAVLHRIRAIDGIASSETNLLLATRRSSRMRKGAT